MSIVVAAPESPVVSADWRRVLPPIAVGLLLLGALFNKEVVAAVQTWDASTAYNHCFLVIPIALYLLWDRRSDLVGIPASPIPAVLLLALPAGAAWLIAERLGIMEGRQLIAVGFAELLFLAVLGTRLWWAMAGPLLYLLFLVPFGEFLTPQLQDVTTWFIRHGLEILGVPAYIDGYVIEIPQGTFFVAEACAGLRFLIASLAFGCLYALMMYRSPVRRGVFIAVSIVVPIIANGFRGIGIVYLGYLLGSAQAAAADHLIYGWVFFSAVILLLIALGLPFRQDEISTRSAAPPRSGLARTLNTRTAIAVALGVVALAAITPALAAALSLAAASTGDPPAAVALGAGCQTKPIGAEGRARAQHVSCAGVPMDMKWEAFSPRSTAASVMAARRRMVIDAETEGLSERWLDPSDGSASAWRVMHSNDTGFTIAVAVWIEGKPTRPGLTMRLRMAMNSLFGSAYAPMLMTITPAVTWENLSGPDRRAAEASLTQFLREHRDLDGTVGALSHR